MGQRTQMVVEVVKPEYSQKAKRYVTKRFVGSYHNQWGIGKMQLWDVMRFLTNYNDGLADYELPKYLHKAYLMEDAYTFKGKPTPQAVMEWMNTTQDNNDGGILLKVKMDKYGVVDSGELYIFNDPEMGAHKEYEKNPKAKPDYSVNRYISLREYIMYCPEYFTVNFLTAFTALLRCYNIKIMEPKDD